MIARIAALLKMKAPETNRGLLFSSGTTKPTDGSDGYQTGCVFMKTDGGVGTSLYVNEGSVTSSAFNAIEPLESITLGDLADVADAYATRILETGTYQSTASGGLAISSANARPFTIVSDDAGVATTGDIRVFLSRTLMTIDKATGTLNAIRGQVKMLDGIDTTATAVVVSPITGYIEMVGTGARSLAGHVAAMRATIEEGASGTTTVAASSFYAGLEVTLNSSRTYAATGTMAGIIVNTAGGSSLWPVGISLNNCTIGIDIAGAMLADENRTNKALVIGARGAAKTVTFASGTSKAENFEPIQMNFACGGANPDVLSTVNIWQGSITHTSAAMADLRLKWTDLLTTVDKNCTDIYIHQAELKLTGSPAVTGEVAVLGLVLDGGSGSPTNSSWRVINCTLRGAGTPVNSAGIFINQESNCGNVDAGIRIQAAATMVSAFRIGAPEYDNTPTHLFQFPADGTSPIAAGNYEVHGGTKVRISVLVGGVQYYMLASTEPTTQS